MAGGLIFTVVCAVQLGLGAWFGGKVFNGVTVANVQLGGLSRAQAHEALAQRVKDYQIKINAGGKQYVTTPDKAGIAYDIDATLDQALLVGHNRWLAPIGVLDGLYRGKLQYAYTIDQHTQAKYVASIVDAVGKPAADATVVVENGEPKAQLDVNGVGLSTSEVSQALNRQAAEVRPDTVTLASTAQPARIKVADVQPAIVQTRALLATPVTITYAGKVFKPTPAQMGEWVGYDKTASDVAPGLTPKANLDGIKHYLQSVAVQVNVNPINKKVTVENGVSRTDREGVDGLQLNQDALAAQIRTAFIAKQPFTAEAPTTKVSFQTEYNKVVTLAYGKYIEVNLSKQHLWVYQDQKVIFESPVTSGATGAGYPTVQGLFSIQAKQTNRNLNGYAIGYNYNVFVSYWMPFYGNYGLHDASWRSAFGGSDYYYGGSHGCVNLPTATAAFIYGWADVGTPVWVHS